MRMTQTVLASGQSRMVTWLPVDKRIRPGAVVSLDKSKLVDSSIRWTVLEQSEPIESGDIKRGWNNNI